MTFQAWTLADGVRSFAIPHSPAGPILLQNWSGPMILPKGGSVIVLPTQPTRLVFGGSDFTLAGGCYAQVPGGANIYFGGGLLIHTPAYEGLAQAGGPVEALGRLRYIDGCSDSLLICPALVGDPCLNLLHLPAGIHQTAHTHPSDRIGIILRGAGRCLTPESETPLEPGMFWHIPPETVHSFHTDADSLDVLAWHPDSDFGPSHDWHPMVNRTIVEGLPANDPKHAAIRTRGAAAKVDGILTREG